MLCLVVSEMMPKAMGHFIDILSVQIALAMPCYASKLYGAKYIWL
jgi:hypothetical protein